MEARDAKFDTSKCKVSVTSGPGTAAAGKQIIVAAAQKCTGSKEDCQFNVATALTLGNTFSTGSTTTLTNTLGGSLSIQAGVNFIFEGAAKYEIMYQFAKSVAYETHTDITNSTTFTATNILKQRAGTNAYVTFTPTHECWKPEIACGGPNAAMDYCRPSLLEGGKGPQGDYTVVYTA